MLQIQPSQIKPVKLRCRLEMAAADAFMAHEFCVFDFPGCKGCPNAQPTVRTVGSSQDPMKPDVWHAWIARVARPKLFVPIREVSHGFGEVRSHGEPGPVQETSR
jgi:hypothetical protein